MSKRITITALLVAFVACQANAQHTHRNRGALLGGLAGAALGVAIGDKGNNETAGALIGGVAGAVAGGAIGNQKDQRIRHYRRYHSGYHSYHHQAPHYQSHHGGYPNYHQPYYYPQHTRVPPTPAPVVVPAEPVTPATTVVQSRASSAVDTVSKQDVITMFRNGMSDKLIIQQIQLHGVKSKLSVADVIELHEMGISEEVITAIQTGTIQTSNSARADEQLIIEPGRSYRFPHGEAATYGESIITTRSP